MFKLSEAIITIAFDCASAYKEVRLKAGTCVNLLTTHGTVATCSIGIADNKVVFHVPLGILVPAQRDRYVDIENLPAPEEEEDEKEELVETIEEKMEAAPEGFEKLLSPEDDEAIPEGKEEVVSEEGKEEVVSEEELDIDELLPGEAIKAIELLPPEEQREIIPPEFVGKIKFDPSEEKWQLLLESVPAMWTYPDSGPYKDRFIGWEMQTNLYGYNMYDTKRLQKYEAGTVAYAVEIADKLMDAEKEIAESGDKPGVYKSYMISSIYDSVDGTIEFQILDKEGKEVGVTNTYQTAIDMIDKLVGV